MRPRRLLCVLIAVGAGLSGLAPAADAAQSPSLLVPATRADQLPVAPAYRRPVLEPRLRTAASVAPTAPFRLRQVRVLGSSLPPDLVQRAYAPWLGRIVDDKALQAIADRIAAAYAAHTDIALYAVSIPRQDFQDGVARIEASEGYIQGARVTAPAGSHHGDALLRRYLDRLLAERPLRRSTLERYSALIRDIAGLNPSLQFVPGATPGALVLVVATAPRTVEADFGVNDRGTAYLGRTQADVDLALHALFRQGDDTHFSAAAPTDLDRFRYYAVSHAEPLGASGASMLASAGYLQTRPSFADLHGHAFTLGVSATAPVMRRNAQSLYLTGGLDGVNSDNALLGQAISSDRIRTLRLAATYVRQNTRVFVLVNGSANFGLDFAGAHTLSPQLSRLDFHKYTLKLNANVALTRQVVLRLNATGQYACDLLPGSEQLALGGEEFGRAYEAAVVAGDQGAAGSAELAWKLAELLPARLQGSEVYAFTDAGEARRLARPSAPAALQQLASVGGGARIAVTRRAVLQLEADRGLLNPVPTEDHESWRGVFSIRSTF